MMMAMLLVLSLTMGVMPAAIATGGTGNAAPGKMKLSIISDTHLFSADLGITGPAFEAYLAGDRKLIAESEDLLDAAIEVLLNNDSEVILIPGDLTKDGEKYNHELMAQKLQVLLDAGKRVFVTPGNHDINNTSAYGYTPEGRYSVETVSPEEFRAIYKDCGYSDAIAVDTNSLSYVVEPVAGYRVMAIDSCIYSPTRSTGGRFSPELLAWVLAQIKDAKNSGKEIVAFMHHGLVPHFSEQPTYFAQYLINDYENISNQLADAGLGVVFTGHYHAQNISKHISPAGNKIYDCETGSLVTNPCPIRNVVIDGKAFSTGTVYITDIKNTNNTYTGDFQAFARSYVLVGLENQVVGLLASTLIAQGMPPAAAMIAAEAAANTFVAPGLTLKAFVGGIMADHYAGTAAYNALSQAIVSALFAGDEVSQILAVFVHSVLVDMPPGNNAAAFKLNENINTVVSAIPSAYVTKLNGNKNDLTITVKVTLLDGRTSSTTKTFSINNNAAGTYVVGEYKVYVDTKGNDQIRACYIV